MLFRLRYVSWISIRPNFNSSESNSHFWTTGVAVPSFTIRIESIWPLYPTDTARRSFGFRVANQTVKAARLTVPIAVRKSHSGLKRASHSNVQSTEDILRSGCFRRRGRLAYRGTANWRDLALDDQRDRQRGEVEVRRASSVHP